ncbi:MAG: carboxymuconolactone decarboxylase family protein [Polyangiaceae bacterium]
MVRDDERKARAAEVPVVDGLPEVPGILAAMSLSPGMALHLRGLVDELLVNDFAGATLTRGERELLATAVSAANDCFYCMDSHGAFATELLRRACVDGVDALVDGVKSGGSGGVGPKMEALLALARTVQGNPRKLTREAVVRAIEAGASDADTQLAVLIASAFCMYNRMVDGLRAATPPRDDAYRARAAEIADHGYADPRVRSVPR